MKLSLWIISVAVSCLPLFVQAVELNVGLQLKSDAVATKEFLTLQDVAKIDSQEIDDLNAIVLMRRPRVGHVEQLTRNMIEGVIRTRYPEIKRIEWSGAEKTQIRSLSADVDAALIERTVVQSLHSQLGAIFPKLQVQVTQSITDLSLPVGDVELVVRPLSAPLFERMPVWVDVKVNGKTYRTATVSVALRSEELVYVAPHELSEGAVVSFDSFEKQSRNIIAVTDPVSAPEIVGDSSLRLKKRIRAGQVLTKSAIHPADMVLYGDPVQLSHKDGGIVLEVRAIAEQQARVGERIKVKPLNSTANLVGLLVAPGIVETIGK